MQERLHSMVYFGPVEPNFRALTPTTTSFVEVDEKTKKFNVDAPGKKANGLTFRWMRLTRRPEQDLVVGVANLVMRVPVVLVHERHVDNKAFTANGPFYLGDESAMRLLIDLAVANTEYRDVLARHIRDLGASP